MICHSGKLDFPLHKSTDVVAWYVMQSQFLAFNKKNNTSDFRDTIIFEEKGKPTGK